LKSRNHLARLAAAGLLVSALACQSPAQAAPHVDQIQRFIDCLGWMFTDQARHTAECAPTHEFFLSDKDTGAGHPDPASIPAAQPSDPVPTAPSAPTDSGPPTDSASEPPPPTDDCEVSTKAPLLPIGTAILRADCPIEGSEESLSLEASAKSLSI
jgi:hypothetical protein